MEKLNQAIAIQVAEKIKAGDKFEYDYPSFSEKIIFSDKEYWQFYYERGCNIGTNHYNQKEFLLHLLDRYDTPFLEFLGLKID